PEALRDKRFGGLVSDLPTALVKKIEDYLPKTIFDADFIVAHTVCRGAQSVVLSSQGKYFITRYENEIRVWDTDTLQLVRAFYYAEEGLVLRSILAMSDGFFITKESPYRGEFHKLVVRDLETFHARHQESFDPDAVPEAIVSPDGSRMVTVSKMECV